MELLLKNGKRIIVRPYEEKDFGEIMALTAEEGWTGLAGRKR
ncbi:hypothetical protein [Peribacillus sp. SCS-37]